MRPLDDYSFIRGVCYRWGGDQAITERDLGYAQRLRVNSTRIWLRYAEYWEDPEAYISKLRRYVKTAHSRGITTMPILWSGIRPKILEKDYLPTGEAYVADVVGALKSEDGLLMWDIANEPTCPDIPYFRDATPEEMPEREAKVWGFVRHFCEYVRSLDPENAITVGNTFIRDTEPTVDLVDVISFHDYLETRNRVENTYIQAEALSAKYGKPLINSELACLCRANPYDMALEICERHNVGWYLFELMVHGYWGDVHGIVYPDGTVRDPAIISAMFGFHRNRDAETRIRPNPNKEGHVDRALKLVEEALTDDTTVFRHERKSTDDLLEAAEFCANLLEGSEMVPMIEAPTVRILAWRRQPEDARDVAAIRAFTWELARTLKKWCQIM